MYEILGFCQALTDAGITFVRPTVTNLQAFGDKTPGCQMAIVAQVPVVSGSPEAFAMATQAAEWIAAPANNCDYPVIVKTLMVVVDEAFALSRLKKNCPHILPKPRMKQPWPLAMDDAVLKKYVEPSKAH